MHPHRRRATVVRDTTSLHLHLTMQTSLSTFILFAVTGEPVTAYLLSPHSSAMPLQSHLPHALLYPFSAPGTLFAIPSCVLSFSSCLLYLKTVAQKFF